MSFSSKIRSTMTEIATAEEPKQQDNKTYDDITPERPSSRSTGMTDSKGSGSDLAKLEKEKQFKRLTKAEFADKRSNGLCFSCDKKFIPGHRCASPALQVLLVDKENKDDGVADKAKLSLNSAGFKNNYTMRLRGILGGKEVVVLIDSGSSSNLISSNLVERLGITVMGTSPFGSTTANGEAVYNQGICKGVIISFSELQVVEDFLQFKMGNTRFYDVILGITWLKTLGDVVTNWQKHTMTFCTDDSGKITLKGDPDLCRCSRVPAN